MKVHSKAVLISKCLCSYLKKKNFFLNYLCCSPPFASSFSFFLYFQPLGIALSVSSAQRSTSLYYLMVRMFARLSVVWTRLWNILPLPPCLLSDSLASYYFHYVKQSYLMWRESPCDAFSAVQGPSLSTFQKYFYWYYLHCPCGTSLVI